MMMQEYPDVVVLVGVPVAVLTALVVEALKEAGLPTGWAPLVAVVTAGLMVGMTELAVVVSWVDPLSRILAGALVIGLASSGGYSWARAVGKGGDSDV
jgi:hypothetical protein